MFPCERGADFGYGGSRVGLVQFPSVCWRLPNGHCEQAVLKCCSRLTIRRNPEGSVRCILFFAVVLYSVHAAKTWEFRGVCEVPHDWCECRQTIGVLKVLVTCTFGMLEALFGVSAAKP